MKLSFIFLGLLFVAHAGFAQQAGSANSGLKIGGYAQIDYNQPITNDVKKNGILDIHRLVTSITYQFNSKTKFISELEVEHVKEVAIEQAFLSYRINQYFNLKGGLLLIPMGLINLYHEPPIFHGVERPNLDKYIVPSTWREMGVGFSGKVLEANIRYQFYLINGFKSYETSGTLRGIDALRKGRQKGAKSFISSPNLSTKVDYYGIPNLKLGLSFYLGKTQSSLKNNISKNNQTAQLQADSSVIGINMVGIDARFEIKKLQIKGQFISSQLLNTSAYNQFTGMDLGEMMQGYYIEFAYNLLPKKYQTKLFSFIRIEQYNTHYRTVSTTPKNPLYNRREITTGFTWKLSNGAVWKADLQFLKAKSQQKFSHQFNLGVGINF